MSKVSYVLRWPLIAPIKLYQLTLGAVLPPSCRFYPSCSQYAIEAIERHGAFYGLFLAIRRISRCHPFNLGGYDPVPPVKGE